MRWLPGLLLAVVLAAPVGAATDQNEQAVTPLAPAEQRIEAVAPAGEQHVEALDEAGVQRVSSGTTGPAGRVAHGVAKVAVGVLAGVVSLGVMIGSLLLI